VGALEALLNTSMLTALTRKGNSGTNWLESLRGGNSMKPETSESGEDCA